MKKICFLIGNLSSSGGTERVTTLIANNLVEYSKYEISILSLVDGKIPFFDLDPKISIHSLHDKKVSFKSNFLGAVWKIRKFIQENKIDTLIVVDSLSCIFTIPALIGLSVNHICWEHFNFKNNNGVPLRDLARKLAAKYCDYIVTLTNKDIGFWKEGVKKIKANLVCIPNPTPFIPNDNIPKLKYKIVLSVGRLVHVKGYDLLIKAWEKSIKNNPDWKLCIVGDGPEEKSLKKLVEDLKLENTVIFTGRTNDVTQYYSSSSFFCLSSRNEGLPMVLLEAQSYNLPLIAFDCDTGPSEVISNNINGYLVKNGDIDKLSDALINMIDIKALNYMQLSKNAKQGALKFDPKNIAKQWYAII